MDIDILCEGTDDLTAMNSLSCCWPPGTQGFQSPEPESE